MRGIVPGGPATDAFGTGTWSVGPEKVLKMIGKADDPSTGGTGRTNGRPTPARARGVRHSRAAMPIDIDSSPPIPDPLSNDTTVAVAAPLPPDVLPRQIRTQASYRQLVASGLTGAEAAGVIGYVSGLPTGASPWTMSQINRLLFLRSLYTDSEWGKDERRPAD